MKVPLTVLMLLALLGVSVLPAPAETGRWKGRLEAALLLRCRRRHCWKQVLGTVQHDPVAPCRYRGRGRGRVCRGRVVPGLLSCLYRGHGRVCRGRRRFVACRRQREKDRRCCCCCCALWPHARVPDGRDQPQEVSLDQRG